MIPYRTFAALLTGLLLLPNVVAVKTTDFKTCSQASFCRRGRALASRAQEAKSSWKSPYSVLPDSVSISPDSAVFTAAVQSSLYPEIKFSLELRIHDDGVVRVRMDEVDGLRKRYDEAASWALISEPEISKDIHWTSGKNNIKAVYGNKKDIEVVVSLDPLTVTLSRNGKKQVVLNGRGLLHMEHFREKPAPVETTSTSSEAAEETPIAEGEEAQVVMETEEPVNPTAWFEGDDKDGLFDEKFNSWTDSKPKGPESLSIDITFPNHGFVYGIPQHATKLNLPTTTGESPFFSEPYRLYNADVFEYMASSTMSLYGSIPVMHAHSADSTVGVFQAVGSETWIDVSHPSPKSTETHWISESGIMDIFLMPGPSPEDIFKQYSGLTGTTVLPALWSLGYHQCRWNYVSSTDVRMVQSRFDEEDIPFDVLWLDIEYADEHKYFIWDEKKFPDPIEMTNDVAALGRKMVVIIDPHLKRTSNYPVYKEASEKGLLVKPKSGEGEYEGWCWSGSSSWIDFFNPASWSWWHRLYRTEKSDEGWTWTQSTKDIHIWNDMNEPAIFNGPEISMQRDSIHYGGWEHRDVHNINGMLYTNQTFQAVEKRTDYAERAFVLTRSFFAGSQRYGAMWTGDNLGTWEHMEVGLKMVLSNSIAGMANAGSDVGGFFGNPDNEMLVRWYQVGIFNPFFRAHAHLDTKRREPYLLDEPYKGMLKDLIRLRYSMLPIWYTAFRETSVTGLPVVRPHYVVFPKDEKAFDVDDQFFIGDSGILVKPVTKQGATETTVYLPPNQVWYDYFTCQAYQSPSKGKEITVAAPLSTVPVFIKGGSILPTRERHRRASQLMKNDPFTLRVALDKNNEASGELYLDDGDSFKYRDGDFVWRKFIASPSGKKKIVLKNTDLASVRTNEAVDPNVPSSLSTFNPSNNYAKSIEGVRVEKIMVLGLASKPSSVKMDGKELVWTYENGVAASGKKEGISSLLSIKDPKAHVGEGWDIEIHL